MVAGPETARVVQEFEDGLDRSSGMDQEKQKSQHHGAGRGIQSAFLKDVTSLVARYSEIGNPFLEESKKIIALDAKEMASVEMVTVVQTTEKVGNNQYNRFINEKTHWQKGIYRINY